MYNGTYGEARNIYPSANAMLNRVTELPDKDYYFMQFKTYSDDIYNMQSHPDSQDWIGFDPFMISCTEIMHKAADQYVLSDPIFQDFYNAIRNWLPTTETAPMTMTETHVNSLWDDFKDTFGDLFKNIGFGVGMVLAVGIVAIVVVKRS